MKVLIFTKSDGPEMRNVIEMGKELEETDIAVEYYDTEDYEGIQKSELYNVMITPSLIVARDDGSVAQEWKGNIPPRVEVEGIARS